MIKRFAIVILAALALMPLLCSAEMVLAKGGKALYTIVERPDAARLEKAAVKDLKLYLDKITGGDFKIGKADSKRIFVGVKAPGDNKPMEKAERRFKVVDGDLYIYGQATDSAAWGIYDFLEKHCGCRWYTAWGDEKVPRNADLTISDLDESRIPSFRRFETASIGGGYRSEAITGFVRRRRVHITPDKIPGDDDYLLGVPLHTFCKYIPSGKVPKGKFVTNIGDAYKYFADKKYFETNPEWFTMDETGKRVWNRQLCLSNKELRKEFLKNLEIVIEKEYKGGEAVIVVDMNDRNNYLCKCTPCRQLIEKYGTEGGPLYDYLLELSKYFSRKYPEIALRALAYGCSQEPPNCDLPENVMMWYAPLGSLDYMKSYADSVDQGPLQNLKKHAKRSKAMWKWMYLTPFLRGHSSPDHIANIQRLVDNLRIYKENNIKAIMTELGMGVLGTYGFQELRLYVVSAMKEDLSQDEKAVIRDFMDHCYGKAADGMFAYLQELEKLNRETAAVLRWINRNPMSIPYLTPERLIRWSADFDRMEKLTADDPRCNLHVKRARLVLDQVVLCKWHELAAARPEEYTMERFEQEKARYTANVKSIREQLFNNSHPGDDIIARNGTHFERRAMSAISNAPEKPYVPVRPLPPELADIPAERIRRAPYLNNDQSAGVTDPDAAFGFSLPGRAFSRMTFSMQGDNSKTMSDHILTIQKLRAMPHGKYHYYYLGDCTVSTEGIRSRVAVTEKQSAAQVDGFGEGINKADVYISVKFMPPNKIWLDELLIVKNN